MRIRRGLMSLVMLSVAFVVSSQCMAARTPARTATRMRAAMAARTPASLPQAKTWLKKMSDYLGTLNKFQVHIETSREIIFPRGGRIDENSYGDVFMQRPNMLRVNLFRANKVREIYYNGQTLTVFSPKQNFYGEIAAPPTIDAMLKMAMDKYGIEIPLANLLSPNVYDKVAPQIDTGIVVGPSFVNGVYCKQLAFRSGTIDWQIWIQDSQTPLPMQVVIVDRAVKGNPRYTARLTDWNTNPTFTESTFTFTPPAGAKKIQFINPEQARARMRTLRRGGTTTCPSCR